MPEHVSSQLESVHLVVSRAAGLGMTLNEFLNWLETRNHPAQAVPDEPIAQPGPVRRSKFENISLYIEYTSLRAWMPELERDTPPLSIESHMLQQSANAWISDGNTLGKLHFDAFEGLLSPIAGAKIVTLVPPYANELLGGDGHMREGELTTVPLPDDGGKGAVQVVRGRLQQSTSMVHARVDLVTPPAACAALPASKVPAALQDLCPQSDRNRGGADALLGAAVRCRVGPGETLFIPSFWWHEVQSEPGPLPGSASAVPGRGVAGNIAINSWFHPVVAREFPCPAAECPYRVDTRLYGAILEMLEGQ